MLQFALLYNTEGKVARFEFLLNLLVKPLHVSRVARFGSDWDQKGFSVSYSLVKGIILKDHFPSHQGY